MNVIRWFIQIFEGNIKVFVIKMRYLRYSHRSEQMNNKTKKYVKGTFYIFIHLYLLIYLYLQRNLIKLSFFTCLFFVKLWPVISLGSFPLEHPEGSFIQFMESSRGMWVIERVWLGMVSQLARYVAWPA